MKVPQLLLLLLLSRGLREFARWLVQLRYDTFNFRFGRRRTFSPVQGFRIPFVPRSYSLPLSLYAIVHSSTVLVALNSLHLITIQCGMPGHIDQAGSSARPGAGGEWKVMEDAISGPSHKLYLCVCWGGRDGRLLQWEEGNNIIVHSQLHWIEEQQQQHQQQ